MLRLIAYLVAAVSNIGHSAVIAITSIVVAFFSGTEIEARTYYVAANGNDNDSGSETEPLRSVQKAADLVRVGDTVLLRGALFSQAAGCLRQQMTWCAALRRYLWWRQIPNPATPADLGDTRFEGGFGVYDAPEPWGPWTTAFFTNQWDVGPGETASFPAKWIDADGRKLWLVFSGDDCFSVRAATIVLTGAAGSNKH